MQTNKCSNVHAYHTYRHKDIHTYIHTYIHTSAELTSITSFPALSPPIDTFINKNSLFDVVMYSENAVLANA